MRISWISNAPWARTGYGTQTNLIVPRLQGLGHEVQITAFYGLEGGILQWNGPKGPIPVYPRAHHPYGLDVLAAHAQHFGADIAISLIDAWVLDPAVITGGVKWVAYFPIDHLGIPEIVLKSVRGAWSRIVYSRFAETLIHNTGLDCYYCPHGIDTKIFHPIDRAAALKNLKWPADRFIVSMVAANKGNPSRKAFPENLRAFAELKKIHPDAWLYLHTVAGEENGGVNLPKYLESLGLRYGFTGRNNPADVDVLFNDQYQTMLGLPEEYLNAVYNCSDVHLLVSAGEGFGLPIIEAQAAGCPVIVGDWTSMPELVYSGWKIPRSQAHEFYTPMGSYQYYPKVSAILAKLKQAYKSAGNQEMRDNARTGALNYDIDTVIETYWKPALEDMQERINAWKPADKPNRAYDWCSVGLYNPDGSMDVPDRLTGDALRVYKDRREEIIPGGFTNPYDLKFKDADGLEWLLMREFDRDYQMKDLQLDQDSVIVDIGAHVGIVSISAAKLYGCRVHAYEPDFGNYRRLVENIILNGTEEFILPFHLAVTADGRVVKIGGGGGNSGGRNIYQSDGSGVNCNSLTLQDIYKNLDGKIDLLKMDCEGAEYEILADETGNLKPEIVDILKTIRYFRGEFHGPKAPGLKRQIQEIIPDTVITLQGLNE